MGMGAQQPEGGGPSIEELPPAGPSAEQMPCIFCGGAKHVQSKCTLYLAAKKAQAQANAEKIAEKRAATAAKAAEKAAAAAAGVPAPP